MSNDISSFDILKIMELLPHRYPFLLVDRVLEHTPDSIVGIKNVTMNEPFFQGHFPGLPVMPGVLIVEAMAQTAGLMVLKKHEDELANKVFLFSGIEKVRFRKPVGPGDQMVIKCVNIRSRLSMHKMSGQAFVDDKLVAEAIMTCAVLDREQVYG